jgi:hypothetical protein
MAKKGSAGKKIKSGYAEDLAAMETALTHRAGRPSGLQSAARPSVPKSIDASPIPCLPPAA